MENDIYFKHIFLSYSHKDFWEMRAVYNEFRLAGFRIWIDDQLTPGTPNWQQAITSALDASACVVCICSPSALHSKWVNIELELASQREIQVYPVLVSGTPKESIPVSLTTVQFTNCRSEYATPIAKLIEELMNRHVDTLMLDVQNIFSSQDILWTRFGSLFWFASEVRKLRLFLSPENPSSERVKDSLTQLLHHAKRINVDKFTLRDIKDVMEAIINIDFATLNRRDREFLENKLRLAQDKVAGLAEKADSSFSDGPRPGKPVVLSGALLEEKATVSSSISILFLASDPTDASRLRLGEEIREIQEKLQLAKYRERFNLHQRSSVRPEDISQAMLDIQPQIVHFSGHGTSTGALYFENVLGSSLSVMPEALASLFEQFKDNIDCVILNACYSEIQAKAIIQSIKYVIGMNQAIGDKAAIAFTVGFYQALGAGRSVEEAYRFGCVQIKLQGISEDLIPVFLKKEI